MSIKKLTIKDVQITVECLPEDISVRGNCMASGDDSFDKYCEDKILAELEHNPWAWCTVKVTVECEGLEATDYLGGCSYRSKNHFIRNSGYYRDMVNKCLEELNEKVECLVELVTEED